MVFAYADPPYPGSSKKHYGMPEVNHPLLISHLINDFPDGWALSTGAVNLKYVLNLCPEDVRVGVWVKRLVFFRPGVNPSYAWEPVIFWRGRKRPPGSPECPTIYDWVEANTTFKTGCPGAKPEKVCWWIFEMLGAQPADELVDIFPGSGAVTKAWESWRRLLWNAPRPTNKNLDLLHAEETLARNV